MSASVPEALDWNAAWRALSRAERRRIASRVRRGARLVRPDEAALAAWFAVRELERWPRFVALLVGLALWPMLSRVLPVDPAAIAYLWAGGILAMPALVWLYLTNFRPALRASLQANLEVAAGVPPPGPPDPRAAAQLLRRAEKEGWLRGTRHFRRRGLG